MSYIFCRDTVDKLNPRIALVADDDPVTLAVIEQNLRSIGIKPLIARDGAEAMTLFDANEQIQLVMCDLNMPKYGGLDVCRHVRSREHQQRHTPFILFTAEETASYDEAAEAGVDDFLPKPLRRNELLVRVRSLLRIEDLQRGVRDGYALLAREHQLLVNTRQEFARIRDIIVHDLKNPLASLLTNSRYLLGRVPPEERETMLDVLYASENVHRIVDNMSDITKAWERPLSVTRATVDVGELVSKWVSDAKGQVELNMRKIALEPADPGCVAPADALILRRVLDNLLDNAMRYAPSGSMIKAGVKREGDELVVRLQDEGASVPPAARAELFDMSAFAREQAPAPGGRQGRGLGLVFCKLAIEAHGGHIWVDGGESKGNCFCFSLHASSEVTGAS